MSRKNFASAISTQTTGGDFMKLSEILDTVLMYVFLLCALSATFVVYLITLGEGKQAIRARKIRNLNEVRK